MFPNWKLALASITLAAGCTRGATTATTAPVETVAIAPTPSSPIAATTTPTPAPTRPLARWRPAREFEDLGDGRRGAVAGGRRVVVNGDTVTVVDAAPVKGLGRPHHLPAPLGGGWLFVEKNTIHFGASFDGALRLVASGVKTEELGIGHESVLARDETRAPVMVSLATGRKIALPVPDTTHVFGLATGEVAALTATGDVYLSRAKGEPFLRVLGVQDVDTLACDATSFVLRSKYSEARLERDGRITRRPPKSGLVSSGNLFALSSPWPESGAPPTPDPDRMLEPLTVAMSWRVVIAIAGTDLIAFDGTTGKSAQRQQGAFAGHENCFPIRGGSPAFVGCNDKQTMTLFRVLAPDKPPTLERTFTNVYTQDFGEPLESGALALAKRCDGTDARGAICLRRADGTWSDLPPVADPDLLLDRVPSMVHVSASSDGTAYAFGWLDGGGDLVIVDARAKAVRRVAKRALYPWPHDYALWGSVSVGDGDVRFLIGGDRPGVIVLRANGTVQADPLVGRMGAIGDKALLMKPDGRASETLDAGKTWHDVTPPPGGAVSEKVSCVAGGCRVGPWSRLGWGPDG